MPKRSGILYAALILLLAVSLMYHVRELSFMLDFLRHGGERIQAPFVVGLPSAKIVKVEQEAELAGLHEGDTILAISRRPYRGAVDFTLPILEGHPGSRLEVQVQSATGAVKTASIELQSPKPLTTGRRVQLITGALIPVFCIALGVWVAAVRIRDPIAWIFLGMMISFGETVGTTTFAGLFGHEDWLQPILTGYEEFSANIWSVFLMLFGVYFPERLSIDRRWPWLKWLVGVPIALRAIQSGIVGVFWGSHVATATAVSEFLHIGNGFTLVHLLAILCFFVSIGYKTLSATTPDARRRVSLLCAGTITSITPAVVIILVNVLRGLPILGESPAEMFVLYLIMLGFPLTIAYVIVIQRAMDVRVVIRQGLQYLLASKGLVALQVILSAAVVIAAGAFGDNMKRPERIELIAGGIIAIFVIRRFALSVRIWIDRRFFREAYDAEQVLTELADKVRTVVETGPLLELVANRISEALHIPRLAVLVNGGGAFQVAYALGYPNALNVIVPADTPEPEEAARKALDAELALPLSLNRKTLGMIMLGPKRSEEPYTKADVRLLSSVATQTGFALENSRLTAEVATEVAQRERVNREIEIAREVQERLFPQELPEMAGLDYAGSCRPALGVGGDYYDFLALPDGKLGIAIGDVSGKGIPAALLMASLRASLRGQTIHGSEDLAALMGNVNKLVYDSSSSNRYATFFYGQYDPATRCLSYVNGGHNPPLVFRQPRQIIRLEVGGPVVGLLPMFTYEQAEVTLNPGDLFLAFTDGISEAMNAADEEWGEERLIEEAWRLNGKNAADSMRELVASADQFVAGAKQHDDMTIIIARVCPLRIPVAVALVT